MVQWNQWQTFQDPPVNCYIDSPPVGLKCKEITHYLRCCSAEFLIQKFNKQIKKKNFNQVNKLSTNQ